mgnify:CR=1 FL=1
MRISTQTSRLIANYTFEEMIDILAEAGYDAIDFSLHAVKNLAEIKPEVFGELRKRAEDKGMCFNQAHAPFHSSYVDEEQTKTRFNEIVIAMERAAVLGAEYIIVHPCQHLPYIEQGVPERLFEINMDFYNRLKPYCEEFGIKVAVENMWQHYGGSSKIMHSTCSRAAEHIRYVDNLDSKWFTACLDIGHAFLVSENPADSIRALGSERLGALHVHDVDGIHDSHTIPYFGVIDWDDVMSALAEIGYKGDLTFEADSFMDRKPKELIPECEKLMAQTGRNLIKKFEEEKNNGKISGN